MDIGELFAPKVPDEFVELMIHILDTAKTLAPANAPKISAETPGQWAAALEPTLRHFDVRIWPEAVRLWALEMAGDKVLAPGDLRKAARSVAERWESDPVKKEWLEQARARSLERRQQARQLQAGSGRREAISGG